MTDKAEGTKASEKKKCFIITPIGEDESPIRRHINGIIDAAICPVLSNDYEIIVSHRLSSPGSINKQVISNIYEADLVIANLTTLNPNVMYELAFRHSIRKPVITIMEKTEKKLPFDITTERTIFYINDSQGVLSLRQSLREYVEEIEKINIDELDNPIYSALESILEEKNILGKIKTSKPIESDAVKYILNRLDGIENKINSNNVASINNNDMNIDMYKFNIRITIKSNINLTGAIQGDLLGAFFRNLKAEQGISKIGGAHFKNSTINFDMCCKSFYLNDIDALIRGMFASTLEQLNMKDVKFEVDILF